MAAMTCIYLDNAATSFPKPHAVYVAVDRYQQAIGAPLGRGGYASAIEVARTAAQARLGVAQLLGDHDARRVIFTSCGTESLNLALQGLLQPGDHVVTTDAEHNSVLRPLHWLEKSRGIRVSYTPCDRLGRVDIDHVIAAVQKETRLVAITHASNVTGAINDIEELGRRLRSTETLLLVDAAQTLGFDDLLAVEWGVDFVAAPAHKGLLAPLGLGVLYMSERAAPQVTPLFFGGTGSESESLDQPQALPDRFESGNHNVPAIFGLAAALEWRKTPPAKEAIENAKFLAGQLAGGLRGIPGVRVLREPSHPAASVVSMVFDGVDPTVIGAILDSEYGICVRTGYLCAARIHSAIGSSSGGVLRMSVGPFNTPSEVETAIAAMREIVPSFV
jgi:cysteine desulfurase/selenocysteine lyase